MEIYHPVILLTISDLKLHSQPPFGEGEGALELTAQVAKFKSCSRLRSDSLQLQPNKKEDSLDLKVHKLSEINSGKENSPESTAGNSTRKNN